MRIAGLSAAPADTRVAASFPTDHPLHLGAPGNGFGGGTPGIFEAIRAQDAAAARSAVLILLDPSEDEALAGLATPERGPVSG